MSLIDVSELMDDDDLGGTAFTRKRPTTTVDNYGLASSTYADTPLTGTKQPAATADVQYLPEGTRLSDVEAFFTTGDLSPGDGKTKLPDLVVDADGNTYRVLHVQTFPKHGYTRALALKLAPGALT